MNDKELLRNRFAANLGSYNTLATVQDRICEELTDLLFGACDEDPLTALEVGTGTGFLTRRLLARYPHTEWTLNDLVAESEFFLSPYAATSGSSIHYLWRDAERLPSFDTSFDLIATASTVQWFDHLPGFFDRCRALLSPQGWLAVSTFGPENFREIKRTTGDGLLYYTLDALQILLQDNGFSLINDREYTRQLLFDSPTEVLRHIKATGVNAIHKSRWTKRRLTQFEELYRTEFSDENGSVSLTYHPILLIARKNQ